MVLPLFAAIVVAPGSFQQKPTRRDWLIGLSLLIALFAIAYLLPEHLLDFALHSPWSIGPLWVLGLAGLAKPAPDTLSAVANNSFKPKPLRGSA
jgi:hypothetical protein